MGGETWGDVHYVINTGATGPLGGFGQRVTIDENNTSFGNHWVVEWIEVYGNGQISATLAHREIATMWPNTTINTAVVTVGNPQHKMMNISRSNNGPVGARLRLNYSPINYSRSDDPGDVVFYGGMLNDAITAAGTGVRGAGVSFSNDGRWRIMGLADNATEAQLLAAIKIKYDLL